MSHDINLFSCYEVRLSTASDMLCRLEALAYKHGKTPRCYELTLKLDKGRCLMLTKRTFLKYLGLSPLCLSSPIALPEQAKAELDGVNWFTAPVKVLHVSYFFQNQRGKLQRDRSITCLAIDDFGHQYELDIQIFEEEPFPRKIDLTTGSFWIVRSCCLSVLDQRITLYGPIIKPLVPSDPHYGKYLERLKS